MLAVQKRAAPDMSRGAKKLAKVIQPLSPADTQYDSN